MKVIFYSALLLLLGTIYCQDNDIPEDVRELEKKLNEVPGFENFGIENINQSTIAAVEDAVRKKCEKNGGEEAFSKLDSAKSYIVECVQSNFNFTQIQEEIDQSRKTGSMDEVFAKYCVKAPIVEGCVKNFTNTIKTCLEEEEKSSLKLLLNITDSLANFVCYKDGDRIAMFVAEGGFECLQSKQEAIEQCANQTLGHLIPTDLSITNLPLFVINDKGCGDYVNFQTCVVKVLEQCEDNTPANIIDALFKYVRRITPCKNYQSKSSNLGAHPRFIRSPAGQPEIGGLNAAFDGLIAKYEPHCLKNGGPKAADEFRQALLQMKNCSNTTQMLFKQKIRETGGIPFTYLCDDFRNGLRTCLTTITEKMKACSSREEAYVPKFGIDIYDSVFNFYCKDDARAIKKFLTGGDVCMNEVHSATGQCVNKTKHLRSFASSEVVTKSELCGDLKTLRNCFMDVASQKCPSNSNSHEFVVGLSDAVNAPCSGCQFMIFNMLMVFLFIVAKIV